MNTRHLGTLEVSAIGLGCMGMSAFYGETDSRINANIPAIEAAIAQYNKRFQKVIYPGAGHAFNNDTGTAYNDAAAKDAYQKAIDFFMANLK